MILNRKRHIFAMIGATRMTSNGSVSRIASMSIQPLEAFYSE